MRLITIVAAAAMLVPGPASAQSAASPPAQSAAAPPAQGPGGAQNPASAAKIDLSAIKCEGFPESVKDKLPMILIWLNGRYAKPTDPPIIDPAKLGQTVQKIAAFCQGNPAAPLITAAEKALTR